MDNVNSFLMDWAIRYIENKDAIKKEIVNVERSKEGFDFIVHYKDRVKYFIIMSTLVNYILGRIKNDGALGVIVLNNLTNIRFVVSEWKRLTDFKFLSIYFINPFSTSDKVWIINPYTHDRICDKASLESGLKSMAEMVEPIGVEELARRVKLLRGESGL